MYRAVPPRLTAPAAVAAAALAGTALVAAVDPGVPGHYPGCPLLALTGWYCPGCGGLRAVHALTRGDLAGAVDRNVLVVALLPLALAAYARWTYRRWRGVPPRPGVPGAATYWWAGAATVVVVAFGVLRNLPVGAWLAP